MKFASYWHDTSVPFTGAQAGPVSGDFEVAVIGAGFTGLNAARKLAKSGVKVALIEAEHVGCGASGRNGGHLNSGHFASFGAARAHFGGAQAHRLWRAYDESIYMIETVIEEEKIVCGFLQRRQAQARFQAFACEGTAGDVRGDIPGPADRIWANLRPVAVGG